MRHYLKLSLLILPIGILMVAYQQCSNVNFKNANLQSQWSHECSEDASKCKETTENFNSGTANKKIDFTWVVDNSGSMAEEVARTQNNLNAFASSLSTYTDLKMAVVSAKDDTSNAKSFDSSPKYITMPSVSGVVTTQINKFVASNDSLILAALSICPANAAADSWCALFQANKKDADQRTVDNNRWTKVYGPTVGTLNGFMREQSHKVFVIVSDDDARAANNPYRVLSDQFLDAYDSRFPNSQPIVYSIVSPRTKDQAALAGCEVYGQGLEYVRLSALTGGKVFDICENDWTPYFNEMLAGIQTLARSSFPLATVNVVEILSVKISNPNGSNSRTLASGEYTYANRTLSIREDILNGYVTFNLAVKVLEYNP